MTAVASPPGLNKKIWAIAWPAILSNVSIPILGLVDTAILGHLQDARYLGAVAIGAAILSFLYWGFGFLRMGTTGLVAQAVGAGDERRALLILLQSAVLALVLATLILLVHPWWLTFGLQLMAPDQTIAPLARSYMEIRIVSAPAVLLTYALVGWFIGHQNTRWPMAFVIATNVLNIVLDLWFIVGLGMLSDGAALATVISEYTGCALALIAAWHHMKVRPCAALLQKLKHWQGYQQLLDVNRYLFVRTLCLLFGFAFFTAQSATMGQDILAANTIMLNLLLLAAYALDGFSYAAEALVGQSLGGGQLEEFYATVKACARWCAFTALLITAVYAVGLRWLFQLFTNLQNVLAQLQLYGDWLLILPLIAAGSYLLDGIFIGAARSRHMMLSMLMSVFVVYLPAWYWLQPWGNNGLWLAFVLFNGARGICLGYCFFSLSRHNRWLETSTSNNLY